MEKLRKRVLELLDYNPDTGIFTRRVSRGSQLAGSVAGTKHVNGYICIQIDGKHYLAHRLAFLVVNGSIPSEIDHINLIKDDNSIVNLRPATRQEICRNTGKRVNNTSGFKGVSFHKASGKWNARAQDANGKRSHLGYFPTPEAASAAYEAYAMNLHGEFYRPTVNQ